jgi:predicted tellurium resistance membrane protein TerC
MELLLDPQAWVSFLTLTLLEIVLGIDNIVFLSMWVDRLPQGERKSARYVGLSFAMLTRLALLFSLIWLVSLRQGLFAAFGREVSGRDLILLGGGAFLLAASIREIHALMRPHAPLRKSTSRAGYWLIIMQIGVIDIVFSLDTVFSAIGLANRTEVMVAAILVSLPVMMGISGALSRFIDRYPSIKTLALCFLALIGVSMIAESLHAGIPRSELYFAMAFSATVEGINIRLRRRG